MAPASNRTWSFGHKQSRFSRTAGPLCGNPSARMWAASHRDRQGRQPSPAHLAGVVVQMFNRLSDFGAADDPLNGGLDSSWRSGSL